MVYDKSWAGLLHGPSIEWHWYVFFQLPRESGSYVFTCYFNNGIPRRGILCLPNLRSRPIVLGVGASCILGISRPLTLRLRSSSVRRWSKHISSVTYSREIYLSPKRGGVNCEIALYDPIHRYLIIWLGMQGRKGFLRRLVVVVATNY